MHTIKIPDNPNSHQSSWLYQFCFATSPQFLMVLIPTKTPDFAILLSGYVAPVEFHTAIIPIKITNCSYLLYNILAFPIALIPTEVPDVTYSNKNSWLALFPYYTTPLKFPIALIPDWSLSPMFHNKISWWHLLPLKFTKYTTGLFHAPWHDPIGEHTGAIWWSSPTDSPFASLTNLFYLFPNIFRHGGPFM